MVGVTAAIIGGAVIGAGSSIISGNKAAKAQKNAAAQQVAEQRRQYDQTRADYAPWRAAGESALSRLTNEMTGGATSAFKETPGYQFRQSEAAKATQRLAAARGRLNSGATLMALQERGDNIASQEYDNWWNRNAGLAGVGMSATNSTTQAGQNAANNISNAYGQAGQARASAYANTGSSINSGINNVLSAYLYQQGRGAV